MITAELSDTGRSRPLPALLSQVLVAFTVEFDNEFERRMAEAGYPGALLSLAVWLNLMRFLSTGTASVRDLAVKAMASENTIRLELGCLERWGFVVLQASPADLRPVPDRPHRQAGRILRDGWGSGRGIRSVWNVSLTEKGRKATAIWPSLLVEIERRWETHFGLSEIGNLREALQDVVGQLDLELPQGLPGRRDGNETYEPRGERGASPHSLPVLLSQLLLGFTIEFDGKSVAPLSLCANTLRVLGEAPIPIADIPRLTGGSRETTAIGWELKPYVVVEQNPAAKRGRTARLTPVGLKVQRRYPELVAEIERTWETRFGKEKIRRIRDCLIDLFVPRSGERQLLSERLVPAPGTVRAGVERPALGRHNVGAAARQRARDLVAQTEMFQRDPASSLPHYPLWDMNRGFGP